MGKNNCLECSKNLDFSSFYNISDRKICFICYNNRLKRMNELKELPAGYGKQLRILEIMVKLNLTTYKTGSVRNLRKIAEKQVENEFFQVIT